MTLVRNKTTPEGRSLGEQHARFFEQELSKRPRELDDRCSTCAFRPGTLANGSPQTQMDVLKACSEHADFYCHEKSRTETLCHGYRLLRAKTKIVMPWPFSQGANKPSQP